MGKDGWSCLWDLGSAWCHCIDLSFSYTHTHTQSGSCIHWPQCCFFFSEILLVDYAAWPLRWICFLNIMYLSGKMSRFIVTTPHVSSWMFAWSSGLGRYWMDTGSRRQIGIIVSVFGTFYVFYIRIFWSAPTGSCDIFLKNTHRPWLTTRTHTHTQYLGD